MAEIVYRLIKPAMPVLGKIGRSVGLEARLEGVNQTGSGPGFERQLRDNGTYTFCALGTL